MMALRRARVQGQASLQVENLRSRKMLRASQPKVRLGFVIASSSWCALPQRPGLFPGLTIGLKGTAGSSLFRFQTCARRNGVTAARNVSRMLAGSLFWRKRVGVKLEALTRRLSRVPKSRAKPVPKSRAMNLRRQREVKPAPLGRIRS
jgi:hypothetical protein